MVYRLGTGGAGAELGHSYELADSAGVHIMVGLAMAAIGSELHVAFQSGDFKVRRLRLDTAAMGSPAFCRFQANVTATLQGKVQHHPLTSRRAAPGERGSRAEMPCLLTISVVEGKGRKDRGATLPVGFAPLLSSLSRMAPSESFVFPSSWRRTPWPDLWRPSLAGSQMSPGDH